MASEMRLTLRLEGAPIERLRTHTLIRQLRLQRTVNRDIHAVYFDTPDRRLNRQGLSFALSHGATPHAAQAILRHDKGLLWNSQCWRWDVEEESADPEPLGRIERHSFGATVAGAEAVLPKGGLPSGLAPLFVKDVRRAVCRIGKATWEAELIVDQGVLRGAARTNEPSIDLAEATLVLTHGSAGDLFRLVADLADSLPVTLGSFSIAERGRAMVDDRPALFRKAHAIELLPGTTIAAAFGTIASACLAQILVNQECLAAAGTPHGGAPEAVHQMRVGLRRLRSAISVFRPLIASPQTDSVNDELRALQSLLAPARDADVFIAEILQPAHTAFARSADFEPLAGIFRARRQAALAVARAAVTDGGFSRLMLRLALWANGEGWLEAVRQFGPGDPMQPAEAYARVILGKRYRRLCRGMQNLAQLDDATRHQARIDAKKFRYSIEFFASLFHSRKAARLAAAVGAVQDSLGSLNDIAVACTTLHDESARTRDAALIWSAGQVAGWHAARRSALLEKAVRDWDACRRLPRFWDD